MRASAASTIRWMRLVFPALCTRCGTALLISNTCSQQQCRQLDPAQDSSPLERTHVQPRFRGNAVNAQSWHTSPQKVVISGRSFYILPQEEVSFP